MTPRRTGLILDAPGTWLRFKDTHQAARQFKAATEKRPGAAGPDGFAPPIQDQRQVGECVGRSVSTALYTVLGSKGSPPEAPFSARAAYNLGRSIDRAALYPFTQRLAPLVDEGASPSQCVRAIMRYGLANMYEIDGDGLEADESLACVELKAHEIIACDGRRSPLPIEWVEIGADEPGKVDQLADALAAGFPACISVDGGDSSFQGYGGGILDWVGAPMDLDHLVTVTYFSTDAAGELVFKIRNSWGEGWGENGCVRVSSRYVLAAGGILVPRIAT